MLPFPEAVDRRRSSRKSTSDTSHYRESSEDSNGEVKKHALGSVDDEYRDPSSKRGRPPAKRAKTDRQRFKRASTVAEFPSLRPDVDPKPAPSKIRIVVKTDKEAELEAPSRPTARKNMTVEQRLATIERQLAEVKRRHRQEMYNMTGRRLEEVGKVTDESIERGWVLLGFNINSIAIQLSTCQLKKDSTVLEVLQTRLPMVSFEGISSGAISDIQKACFKSFMWSFVYTDFFLGCGRQWKGEFVKNIQNARRELIASKDCIDSRTECAKWLSQGHSMAAFQPDEAALPQIVEDFSDTLLSIFHIKEEQKVQGHVRASLHNVVRLATDLTKLFLSSKALLMPDWPGRASTYRKWIDREIEIDNLAENESKERYLVQAPALEKFGNADGENHHISTILRKPEIVYY